jgi:acyl dehydratase
MRVFADLNEISSAVGSDIGVSDWIGVTPDRFNLFAQATYDEQWINVMRSARRTASQADRPAPSLTGSPIVPRAGRFSR